MIEQEWPIWRLVMARVATLKEIETHWSLDDLVRANYALTLKLVEEVRR